MNSVRRFSSVLPLGSRSMTSGQVKGYEKIRAKQQFFQIPDGKMVHEKTRGDVFFFYITAVLTTVGVGMSLKYMYEASFPKKG